MRASADFFRKIAYCIHFYLILVFVAEKGYGALRLRLLKRHNLHSYRQFSLNLKVDHVLNFFYLLGSHLVGMAEVKPEPLCCNIGPLLLNVFA